MTPGDEFSDLSATELRRLARELRHGARSQEIAPRERRLLLVRAAHAAELAEKKEPWAANGRPVPALGVSKARQSIPDR